MRVLVYGAGVIGSYLAHMLCTAGEMERAIQTRTQMPKTVLFGFQGTGGRREDGKAVCVRFGKGSMSLGGVEGEAPGDALRSAVPDWEALRVHCGETGV